MKERALLALTAVIGSVLGFCIVTSYHLATDCQYRQDFNLVKVCE